MLNYSTDAVSGMGACGRVGPILAIAFKSLIVKFDVATEMPVRMDGRCIPCSPGEVGELLVFVDPNMSLKRYDGYLNNDSANSKKILRNVVKTGDHYFRTGDLFREVDGYQYFVDRIGDTFRWKVSLHRFLITSGRECFYFGSIKRTFYVSRNSRGVCIWDKGSRWFLRRSGWGVRDRCRRYFRHPRSL
jgi:acyl-CoA synthetase (AMP-forming)/AMP-acid ligase II